MGRLWSILVDPPPVDAREPLVGQVVGGLVVAGSLLGLLSLLLPHPPEADDRGLYVVVATTFAIGATLLALSRRLSTWRRVAEERSERFFNLSRDMLCTAKPDGYFLEVNDAWTTTLGYSREELLARPWAELVHPDDLARTEEEDAGLFTEGTGSMEFENRYLAKDGSWRWLRWNSTLSAETGLAYARATDVTDQKELEAERELLVAELDTQARTDVLTELPNRRALAEELLREMERAERRNFDLCLALVDLDHFKRFNDRHGHGEGDRLLHEAGRAWRDGLRASDFLARYGGEEFIVLLPDCSLDSALLVIERLRAQTPGDQTCSAGIALWDHRESASELIERADGALYGAKSAGRNRTGLDRRVPVGMEGVSSAFPSV